MNSGFTLVLYGLLAAMLLWIAIQDVRTYTISDRLNAAIALMAPLSWWAVGLPIWPDAAIRVAVAIAVFLLFAGAFYIGAMGGGDVKLAGALALWFAPIEVLMLIIIMSIVGGALTLIVVGVHRARRKTGRPEVPYGVAIALGAAWLLAQRFLNHFA
ncbi:peptidase [Sphingomonas xanthus]|uniref:Peptidase n=2 Tax=Sphingomonas xanthus TaxID=2594473 RepID=A0A516IUL4_9SPHN|nr:peptidase [Sphingomonas xanthus]